MKPQYLKKTLVVFVGLISLSACGPITFDPSLDPTVSKNTLVKKQAFQEVKLIAADIESPQDTRSLKSSHYKISQKSRLLLRLTELADIDPLIVDQYPVMIRFRSKSNLNLQESAALKICPIAMNWMMLATWEYAHPYKGGRWKFSGGDYEDLFCTKPLTQDEVVKLESEERALCESDSTICFDIRSALGQLYRVNKLNYGFILLNDSQNTLEIFGDTSIQQPMLVWRKLRR